MFRFLKKTVVIRFDGRQSEDRLFSNHLDMHSFSSRMLFISAVLVFCASCFVTDAIRIQSVSEAREELLSRERRAAEPVIIKSRSGVFGNGTTLIFITPCVRMETTDGIQIQMKGSDAVRWEVDDVIYAENATIAITDSDCSGAEGGNGTASLTVRISDIKSNASTTEATYKLTFDQDNFNWWISDVTLEAKYQTQNGSQNSNWNMSSVYVGAGKGYSYLCQDNYAFESAWDGHSLMGALRFPQLIVKAFINNTKNATVFGDASYFEPCEYAFTIPLWMATVTGLIMTLILALGISMLVSIKTPDRFDDPKTSKLLSVPAE